MGTGGSRSTTMSGGAIVMVSEKIIAKGKKLAAHMLEAAEGDIEFKDGRFTIAGTDRGLGIHDVAKAAFQLDKLPRGMEPGLYETATYRAHSGNFPNGCPCLRGRDRSGDRRDAGRRLLGGGRRRHRDQPDAGEGPDHGRHRPGHGPGADGGQGLRSQTGQVLAGSFMDYAMPRAENFCDVTIEDNPVPTPTNPLGVKGAGEAGTVGSLSAGVNAIVDALSVYGIRHIDTPCTRRREAIERCTVRGRRARARRTGDPGPGAGRVRRKAIARCPYRERNAAASLPPHSVTPSSAAGLAPAVMMVAMVPVMMMVVVAVMAMLPVPMPAIVVVTVVPAVVAVNSVGDNHGVGFGRRRSDGGDSEADGSGRSECENDLAHVSSPRANDFAREKTMLRSSRPFRDDQIMFA